MTAPAPTAVPVREAGAVVFARYAYPPNALGYCGPDDAVQLLAYAGGACEPDAGLRERARGFDGAWPYLELLGAALGREPLDPVVVRGYWLGELPAGTVPAGSLVRHLAEHAKPRVGSDWPQLLGRIRGDPLPDHAFHVLTVYPWVGLLRAGPAEPARGIVESCCIRPARVQAVHDETVTVASPRFDWDGDRLHLGALEERVVRWRRDGLSIGVTPAPGDGVTIHWDWVCEHVPDARLAALTDRLRRQLADSRW